MGAENWGPEQDFPARLELTEMVLHALERQFKERRLEYLFQGFFFAVSITFLVFTGSWIFFLVTVLQAYIIWRWRLPPAISNRDLYARALEKRKQHEQE